MIRSQVQVVKLDPTVLANAGVDVQQAFRDKALDILTHHSASDVDLNSTEAKKVLRKIDMWLMPMMIVVYWLQLLVSVPGRAELGLWLNMCCTIRC